VPLERDLAAACVVATWSSGAALLAMVMGLHVLHGLPGWIGAEAAAPVGHRLRPADNRLSMFRRLAWAMWNEQEAASGEAFDNDAMTAAHRTLPFGSLVRVTNPATGASVIVRINDRGPFSRGRLIDVSRAAAEELGMIARGHATVELELIEG
jgi:rare lipoprotein A